MIILTYSRAGLPKPTTAKEQVQSTELYILDTIFENINCVKVRIPVIALPLATRTIVANNEQSCRQKISNCDLLTKRHKSQESLSTDRSFSSFYRYIYLS